MFERQRRKSNFLKGKFFQKKSDDKMCYEAENTKLLLAA